MFLIALNNSILVLDFTAHSLQTAKPCEFTRSKAASLLLQATEQSLTSCEDLPVREQMKACTQLTAVFTTQCKTDGQYYRQHCNSSCTRSLRASLMTSRCLSCSLVCRRTSSLSSSAWHSKLCQPQKKVTCKCTSHQWRMSAHTVFCVVQT